MPPKPHVPGLNVSLSYTEARKKWAAHQGYSLTNNGWWKTQEGHMILFPKQISKKLLSNFMSHLTGKRSALITRDFEGKGLKSTTRSHN